MSEKSEPELITAPLTPKARHGVVVVKDPTDADMNRTADAAELSGLRLLDAADRVRAKLGGASFRGYGKLITSRENSEGPLDCVLLIAHPGHELLAYSLFETHRMRVLVLTDGSGGSGLARIDRTRALVRKLNGEMIEPSGAFTDKDAYRAILDKDVLFFQNLVDQLEAALIASPTDALICDAIEYYNPVHDICSVIGALAVRRLIARGLLLPRYVCPIVAHPPTGLTFEHTLADSAAQAKNADILPIAGLIPDLDTLIENHNLRAEVEMISLTETSAELCPKPPEDPYYEEYGRRQILKLGFGELITYNDHVGPLVQALDLAESARSF